MPSFRQPFEVQINAGEKKDGKEDEPSTAAPVPGTGKAVDFAKISIEEAFTTLKVHMTATGPLHGCPVPCHGYLCMGILYHAQTCALIG